MRHYLPLTSLLFIGGLAACSTEPEIQYRLRAEQVAWQGYQPGQTLRFINDQTAAVRTYQVVQVTDEMLTGGKRSGLWSWSTRGTYAFENLYAVVQRTDTAAAKQFIACQIAPNANGLGDPNTASLTLNWDGLPIEAFLPVEALNSTSPLDSVAYGANLLPVKVLGSSSYAQVLQLTRQQYQGSSPTMTLYYAKGKGVVAFANPKTGLWYRLP